MLLNEYISEKQIIIPLLKQDKESVIEDLVNTLATIEEGLPRHRTLAELLRKEALCSTGIGKGVALLHVRSSTIKQISLTIGVIPNGIDYNAFDAKLVKLIILLAAPKTLSSLYLKVLARLSSLLREQETRDKLFLAENKQQVLNVFTANKDSKDESK